MMKKRIVCLLLVAIMCLCSCISVFANEGSELTLNYEENLAFNELAFVKDGLAYIPLRLVFPQTADENTGYALMVDWNEETNNIALTYAKYFVNENNELEFYGTRRKIRLVHIEQDANGGHKYKAYYTKYDATDEDDYAIDAIVNQITMQNSIYFEQVKDGGRAFISVDDIKLITEKLFGEELEYSVTLYPNPIPSNNGASE